MEITNSQTHSFEAKHGVWRIYAKWDGCVEFSGGNVSHHQTLHICDLDVFLEAVTATRDEMKRREYEL